jgi:hypothetical protein
MAKAIESYEKNERETKSIAIDCSGALAAGETVTSIGAAVPTDVDGTPVTGGNALSITGVTPNAAPVNEPGRRPIQTGEGIQLFAAGGKRDVGTYMLTLPFQTSNGQDLDATIELKVK